MCLSIQKTVSAYHEVHDVTDLLLFNTDFETNIEGRHLHALAFVSGTRTTITGVVICTWIQMNVYKSVEMKKKGNKQIH